MNPAARFLFQLIESSRAESCCCGTDTQPERPGCASSLPKSLRLKILLYPAEISPAESRSKMAGLPQKRECRVPKRSFGRKLSPAADTKDFHPQYRGNSYRCRPYSRQFCRLE